MAPIPRLLSEIGSNGEIAFPWKLHIVLEESERHQFEDVISWQGNKAFKVHDPKRFEESVMKEYFNNTQYKSFQRQLNIYGFTRVAVGDGGTVGSYTHDFLVRGKPNMCRFMVRTKVKKRGSRSKLVQKIAKNPNTRQKPLSIAKAKSLPDVNSTKHVMNNGRNAGFSKRKSFSMDMGAGLGNNDGALERFLFNSPEQLQPCTIDDSSGSGTSLHALLETRDTGLLNFSSNPLADMPFPEADFPSHNSSNINIISDSSQHSHNANEISDDSSLDNKFGMVPLRYEQNLMKNNIGNGSNNDANNRMPTFHQKQQQENLNFLQLQQPNRLLPNEYRRLETLKQHQMELQEEKCRLLRLQMQTLHSKIIEQQHQQQQQQQHQRLPQPMPSCIPTNFQNNNVGNANMNSTNTNNCDHFWDTMDSIDLDPTPMLPESSAPLSMSISNSTVVTEYDNTGAMSPISSFDTIRMVSIPNQDLALLQQRRYQ